jgi:hypothetical protein
MSVLGSARVLVGEVGGYGANLSIRLESADLLRDSRPFQEMEDVDAGIKHRDCLAFAEIAPRWPAVSTPGAMPRITNTNH